MSSGAARVTPSLLLLVCGLSAGAQPAREVAARTAAPSWITIPAGRFLMGCVPGDGSCHGNEHARHQVQLSHSYQLMTTEVTVGHYDAYAQGAGVRTPRQPLWNTSADRPVVNVTWHEADSVCRAFGGRLPTEAEWEYAARGGTEGAVFPWGSIFERRRANAIGRTAGSDPWHYTAPAGWFPANGFGLYDMSGNVWEWTADWYAPRFGRDAVRDPRGPETGTRKVIRGGSWDSTAPRVRASVRHALPPEGRYNLYVGLRCARDIH
jgi:sulfatase modifying factor 1